MEAAKILRQRGFNNFFIEAGGDVQVCRPQDYPRPWKVGIRNPFRRQEIVKVLNITNQGLATSGSYERGDHIYNPHNPQKKIAEIISLTVVGPNIYEADRMATAAFAMGRRGIYFIEQLPGFEAYMIDALARATFTSGFERYVL